MEQWDPVIVLWADAHGGDNGWEDPETIEHGPTEVTTVGLLYKHDAAGITVVANKNDEDIGGYTFVPSVNIVSIRKLLPEFDG